MPGSRLLARFGDEPKQQPRTGGHLGDLAAVSRGPPLVLDAVATSGVDACDLLKLVRASLQPGTRSLTPLSFEHDRCNDSRMTTVGGAIGAPKILAARILCTRRKDSVGRRQLGRQQRRS